MLKKKKQIFKERTKVIKFKERVKGNTLYSVGFVSEHKDDIPMVLHPQTV